MDKEFAEALQDAPATTKHEFHLHRRIFLLVFAIIIMIESLLFVDNFVQKYSLDLNHSFKVIFTVNKNLTNEELAKIGESLSQKKDISTVKLFSPEDALEVVRMQNPQLAENMLLMGRSHMPAYFEVRVSQKILASIDPFINNVVAEQKVLTPHYNKQHASLASYVEISAKVLRVAIVFAIVILLLFMFFIEAHPTSESRSCAWGGVLSGCLACVGACVFFVILLYPLGVLHGNLAIITSWGRQVLVLVLGGLLGWTLSKWQKF